MFGLGTTELIIIIGALFLLFIAPSRLPKLASSVGDTIKSFKRGMRDARDVGDDIKEEVREINDSVRRLPAVLLALGLMASSACGPEPTHSTFNEQRKVSMFRVLAYETVQLQATFDGHKNVTIILFEDDAANCYITSGTDGGITVVPSSACEKAKRPNLEGK